MLARCPWYVAGPLLGLLLVAFRVTLNKPFGAMGGYVELVQLTVGRARRGTRANLSLFVLPGIVAGGALYALTFGALTPTLAYSDVAGLGPPAGIAGVLLLVVAGMVMGFGARTAGGCTSGHGLCGTSLGSIASLVSTATFMATAILLAHVFVWIGGGV